MTKGDRMPPQKQPYQYFTKHQCLYDQTNASELFKYQATAFHQSFSYQDRQKYKICHQFMKHIHEIFKNKEKPFDSLIGEIANYVKKIHRQEDRPVQNRLKEKWLVLFHFCLRQFLLLQSFIAHHLKLNERIDKIYSHKYQIYFTVQYIKNVEMTFILFVRENKGFKSEESFLSQSLNEGKHYHAKNQEVFEKYMSDILEKDKQKCTKLLTGQNKRFYLINLQNKLGKGGFGQVYLAQSIKYFKQVDLCFWAIKQYKKEMKQYINYGYSINQDRQYQLLKTIHNLTSSHKLKYGKNIIQCEQSLTSKDKRYIVYQYCPHDNLKEFLRKKTHNKKQIYSLALQLSATLKLLHYDIIENEDDFMKLSINFDNDKELEEDISIFQGLVDMQKIQKGIIHRDIKPKNIMVFKYSDVHIEIKLIDWGFSKRTLTNKLINKISCGTCNYQAPEIDLKVHYNCKIDVWSLGAVFYELLTGNHLIDRKKGQQMKKQKIEILQKINLELDGHLSNYNQKEVSFWRQILNKTLQVNIQKRWNSVQLYDYINNSDIFKPLSSEQFKLINTLKNLKGQIQYHHHNIYDYISKKTSPLKRHSIKMFDPILNSIQIMINNQLQEKVFKYESHIQMVKHTEVQVQQVWRNKVDQISAIQRYCKAILDNYKEYQEYQQLKLCFQEILQILSDSQNKSKNMCKEEIS